MEKGTNKLVLLVLGILIIGYGAGLFLYINTETDKILESQQNYRSQIHARATVASGTLTLCIGDSGVINVSNCHWEINQSTSIENNSYICYLNSSTDAVFSYLPINKEGLFFDVETNGTVRIEGNHSGIGNYSTTVFAYDLDAACNSNYSETLIFRILDINDPPFLLLNIPSRSFTPNSVTSVFYLNSYFSDLDVNDTLNYTVFGTNHFSVYIDPNSSEVIVTNPQANCENDNVYFQAMDSGGLTADSNMVTLESVCVQPIATDGGGAGSLNSCDPNWECKKWSECYPNGTQERLCVDMNGCDVNNLKKTFLQECEYIPTCYDGIQNQGEEGVDCGGPCLPCTNATCSDGIQNQGEEGVDCGGPCPACFVEETCNDGIKNQGETGIDCGGPCPACKQIEVPNLIYEDEETVFTALIILLLVFIVIAVVYFIFRKEISSLYAKLVWLLAKKRRKQVLLKDPDKEFMLDALKAIKKSLTSKKALEFESNDKLIQTLLRTGREFYLRALGLSLEFTKEDLAKVSEQKITHESLKKALAMYYDMHLYYELNAIMIPRIQISMMIEEIRQLVLSTSNYSKQDYSYVAKQIPEKGDMSQKILKLIYNAMIALEFNEVESAKEKYFKIIEYYNLLPEAQRAVLYQNIARLFQYITYHVVWSK